MGLTKNTNTKISTMIPPIIDVNEYVPIYVGNSKIEMAKNPKQMIQNIPY